MILAVQLAGMQVVHFAIGLFRGQELEGTWCTALHGHCRPFGRAGRASVPSSIRKPCFPPSMDAVLRLIMLTAGRLARSSQRFSWEHYTVILILPQLAERLEVRCCGY